MYYGVDPNFTVTHQSSCDIIVLIKVIAAIWDVGNLTTVDDQSRKAVVQHINPTLVLFLFELWHELLPFFLAPI